MSNASATAQPTTVVIETIFCDAENRLGTQKTYFDRFRLTLSALSRVVVPDHVRAEHIVYVSADKSQWLPKLKTLVARHAPHSAIHTRVVRYVHPSNGYPELTSAHPDVTTGPNKQAPLRDRLFAAANVQIPADHIVVRMSLDDDDVWLPWQLEEVLRGGNAARAEYPDAVIGLGLRRTFLCYRSDSGLDVQHVSMNRMLTGNKAFFFPPERRDMVASYAPWNVPELMTENYRERYRSVGIELMILENNRPGFVYMRRGENLSLQHKTGFITATHDRLDCAGERSLVSELERAYGEHRPEEPPVFGIDPPVYRITAKRQGHRVTYSTDAAEVLGPGVRFAYYLFQQNRVVQKVPYSTNTTGSFDNAPPKCRVKIFVMRPDQSRETKLSNVV